MANKPPLGSGAHFSALSRQLAANGARDPDALASNAADLFTRVLWRKLWRPTS